MQRESTSIWSLLRCGLHYVALINIFLITGSYSSESFASKVLSDTFISIVKNTKAPVVNIHTTRVLKQNTPNRGFRIESQGSGVIYNNGGYIITNKHVVKNAGEIVIRLHDGSEYRQKLLVQMKGQVQQY